MTFEWSMKAGDLAIMFATLLGPVLAVQAQKWVERARDRTLRRVAIFRTLMATRATTLSDAHVEALNAIPIEFYGNRGILKKITESWKNYLDHLNQPGQGNPAWEPRRFELLSELLAEIALCTGYKFTLLDIKRSVYFPLGHAQRQADQEAIRQGLVKLLKGEISVPMDVKSFPSDPDFIRNQKELQQSFLSLLAGERSVKVVMDPTGTDDGSR